MMNVLLIGGGGIAIMALIALIFALLSAAPIETPEEQAEAFRLDYEAWEKRRKAREAKKRQRKTKNGGDTDEHTITGD